MVVTTSGFVLTMKLYRYQLGCLFFAAVVTIFLGCRPFELGHDMDAYREIFESALSGNYSVEPLFGLFSLMAGGVGAGFRGILWIYAIASIGVKILFFRRVVEFKWSYIFCFLLIYASSFMWLYDVSQLRASLMLTLIPFLFGARKSRTHTALGFAAVLSHYSGAVAIGQRLMRIPGIARLVLIPLAILLVVANSGQLNQLAIELVLDKYAGAVESPIVYLVHPYFASQVLFLWCYRKSGNEEFGLIAMKNVWWTVMALCGLFLILLLMGSRTAAFRFLEIGLYLSFLFSFVVYVKSGFVRRSGVVCFFLLVSFVLFNFILPEVPIIDVEVLNDFLNPL